MAKKYSFTEPGCASCPHYQQTGNSLLGTRYCGGFPKKRKPRRFRSSDPQFKAPKWCPRRITPPVCRIYGFADEQSQAMDVLIRENFQPKRDRYIFPTPGHYRLQSEKRLNMNAKAFYNAAINGAVYDILSEDDVALGSVIEIDDGLKPYHFYYWGWSTVVPMFSFDRSQVQQQQL